MTGAVIVIGPMLAVVLAALVALGAVVLRLGELGPGREVVVAAVRAVAQLGAVALVITAVLQSGWLTALFVLLTSAVAAVTSARRVGVPRQMGWIAVAIGSGVARWWGLRWGRAWSQRGPSRWCPSWAS